MISYFVLAIYIPANSKFEVIDFYYDENVDNLTEDLIKNLNGDTLLITPGYPSESNKYNTAFVHTRVKEYLKANINVDVLEINYLSGISKYTFENVSQGRLNFNLSFHYGTEFVA